CCQTGQAAVQQCQPGGAVALHQPVPAGRGQGVPGLLSPCRGHSPVAQRRRPAPPRDLRPGTGTTPGGRLGCDGEPLVYLLCCGSVEVDRPGRKTCKPRPWAGFCFITPSTF